MTAFLFQPPTRTSINRPFLSLLAKGPVILFGIATSCAIIAFGYTNRVSAAPGTGMSVDALSLTITACLGLLTVTTNAIVAFLFNASSQ
jgi:hypothetical protein